MATIKRHGTDVSTLYTPQEYSGISLDERANDGETGQGSMPVPDPPGTTAVYAGQSLQLKVGSTVVFDGFLGGRTRDRGEAAAGTRLVNVHPAVDQNALLTGFRSGRVSRPSETDYARMTWFFSTYLPSLDRTWVLNTNTATVAAKTYNTASLWQELLTDLQDLTGKTGFVEGGRAHWHLFTEGIATGKSISDVASDWGSNCYRIHNPKLQSDPLQLANDVRVEDSAGNAGTATDSTSITEHDADGIKHQVLIHTSDTTTSLSAQAATYLAANKDEHLSYECDLGPLTAADVVAMPVGSLITVKSFVMGLSGATQRIAERVLTIKHPDTFYLHLFLSWPVRRNLKSHGPLASNPIGTGVLSWNADDVLGATNPAHAAGPTFWVNSMPTDMSVNFYPANHQPFDVVIPAEAFVVGDNVLACYVLNAVYAGDWAHNPTMFRFRLRAGTNVIDSGVTTSSIKMLPIQHGSGPTVINAPPGDWMLKDFDDSAWADAVTMADDGHWPGTHTPPSDYPALFITPDGPTGTLDTTVLDGLTWLVRCHFTLGPGVPIFNPITHHGGLVVGGFDGTPIELPPPTTPASQVLTIDPTTGDPTWKPSGRCFQFFGG